MLGTAFYDVVGAGSLAPSPLHRSVRQHRIHRLAFWESNLHQWWKLESGVISFPQIEEVRKCPMAPVGLSSN